ncbi:PilT/PilU family type 4a pilus ATPase [Drancourtella massiliensis]|uniref:PilT/PilU family type 4a pilus ATPase n=1 Tax=Drancourtella massiliensis TaxID=1632013 RepID=A0ABS2EDB2_9FIRM|nr:PilT/PilU family type 4a pilus ATPase [Drancourtella massiliensis]MBM6742897.1 PilT/PilU family type 4a pilus ATPase [Drancourtella massiliensis]RHV38754.1 PilT/PilU family type 4a pilus ATPase [Ruminococcus sp. OM05-10BH]
MNALEFLTKTTQEGASDLFIVAGRPLSYKKNGKLIQADEERMMPDQCEAFVREIYDLAGHRDISRFLACGDDDFSFAVQGLSRYRVSTYRQRGSLSAVIRVITFELPNPDALGIPESIIRLSDMKKGLVLVTGPAGSGKSTTLACIIDEINRTQEKHIITLEDPLEFLHRHKKSIVSQREISSDTESYLTALRASLRQSPDVILLGEMRDFETISVAMTAAETGHLVLSTLHTLGAANTIDRIIDVFPPNQQRQISVQLSSVLQAVVSQQLIPAKDETLVPAFELMTTTPAIRNMIRENKIHQIDGLIYSSAGKDMLSMDNSILALYKSGKISETEALSHASNPEMLKRKL